jgi:hypothetical protein
MVRSCRGSETEFEMSQPTAARFMSVAESYGSKLFSVNNLSLTARKRDHSAVKAFAAACSANAGT